MTKNVKFLHQNRDENSFTARLFEGILFPKFALDLDSFPEFIAFLNDSARKNKEIIQSRISRDKPPVSFTEFEEIPKTMIYCDAMLFVECWDLFANAEDLGPSEDKTEFDCMIIGKVGEEHHAIVFEVKCYTDLNFGEIERQQKWLNKLTGNLRFEKFYHLGLISMDNLQKGRSIFKKENSNLRFGIITWTDITNRYNLSSRFLAQVDFNLARKVDSKGNLKYFRSLT